MKSTVNRAPQTTATLVGRRSGIAISLAAWTVLSSGHAAAQQRLIIHTEPGTPIIATEMLLATGPAEEDPERAGIAHVAARSVVHPLRPALDSLGARVAVSSEKDAVRVTLIAPPEVWEEASRRVLVALFRDAPPDQSIEREKSAVRAELEGRRNNPSDVAGREADRSFFGASHPWGRQTVGTAETVARLSSDDVRAFLEAKFTASRTFTAVVGPIDLDGARAHLLRHLVPDGPLPTPLPPRRRSADEARTVPFDAITTWVTVVYPFPAAADVEALRMLAALAADELAFGPTRRAIYDMKAEVTPRTSGGELRFTLVVPPDEHEAWADRVLEVVSRTPLDPHVTEGWEAIVRRYRGKRLLQLASPEARAAAAAEMLFVTGDTSSPIPRFEALSIERLRAALTSLGSPIITFLGPY